MISRAEFQLDENRREILPSFSEDFPFCCLDVTLDHFIGRGLHWHAALELDYVTEDELEYQISDNKTILLSQGDVIFINSNVMHSARSACRDRHGRIYALLFGVEFLSGIFGGLLDRKYMLPLYENPNIPYIVLHPTIPDHIHVIDRILKLPRLAEAESYGYEFEIRSILSEIWLQLLKETEKLPAAKAAGRKNSDAKRLKTMVQFIHEHYMEDLDLQTIAASAGLSEREGTRCFARCLHTPPVLYLNHFRIRMAAQMLLHTDENISVISGMCGFHSDSYFAKVFKETTGLTPRAYRASGK